MPRHTRTLGIFYGSIVCIGSLSPLSSGFGDCNDVVLGDCCE